MMAVIRIALSRPLTFVVMAILIALGGILAAVRTPVDIFPDIRAPVIAVAWTYAGLPPQEMAGRIITPFERALSATVSDVEHIESQSMPGVGVVKVYFQPGVDIRTATAQLTSISQTMLRQLPPGTSPPFIVNYDASTVPIVQLALSGEGLTEQQLYDLGLNQVRPQLITVPGAAVPFPSGGRQRQVQIDLDPQALRARGLSAQDVSLAIAAQNQINPAGFAKIGEFQYNIKLNNAPGSIEALNDLPVKVVDGATIYIRDVANVRDGSAPQTNVVHVNGQRSALMTVLRGGSASTLSIIEGIKAKIPQIAAGLPAALTIEAIGDQSVFVRGALEAVVIEGVIAAALTSLMILLFLGSWRSTAIIALSIPLAVLAAIAALSASGQTLNIMTLGGLALAIGILVDDATVTIENINWHLERGKSVRDAILDGAAQIVTPAFVSLLCICIVFVPMLLLPGVSGYLFVPMALAVVFALIASFVLSRTLVPTLAMYLLRPHRPGQDIHAAGGPQSANPLVRLQRAFEARFERTRMAYGRLLGRTLAGRRVFIPVFLALVLASFALTPWLGRDFFPSVDSGQIALHVRAPAGTRIEETAVVMDRVQQRIRQLIPDAELSSIVDNIGLSGAPLNTVYNNSGTVGPSEGDILIALEEKHSPTERHVERLREALPKSFPGLGFAFLPADITSQILNFGSPAPIDIQISGRDLAGNAAYAETLLRRLRTVPGLADARIQQSARYPQLNIDVDRARIAQYGLTERDVTVSLGNALAGTSQTAPVFFLNPENGVSYPVVAQVPEHRIGSVEDLQSLPVTGAGGAAAQTLGGLSDLRRTGTASVISHYDIQPTINIFAAAHGRDLGAVAQDVTAAIKDLEPNQPKGAKVTVRGQYATMNAAFAGLTLGMIGAVLLIYLVLVVNFQSWADPLVIVSALPGALAGIVWILFVTGTTLSVPALTGAIMCLGVSTANSILIVSFARERLAVLGDASQAALEAGLVRFRPVLMTALAMIIGMAPMALGIGEGGEQNAPLGRAVIGGLILATAATLFLVPAIFSFVHRGAGQRSSAGKADVAHVQ
ncbi:efflux RND transporter permease subunit [uncultured Brevundimonas sp.]|uniref:efflux RND transporter permease subunit n=1 Tax=uncultured Brevundimonas sp. TaxID=213418 RepID=UPI002636B773|nr:efflux RND transporter permease subunit [uncultured Brevundimonas sp.]